LYLNPWQALETSLNRSSVNPRPEIEDPFAAVLSRGRIQQQRRSSKIPFSLNRLADGVVCLVVRKLAELPKFLVFNSGTNSFLKIRLRLFCPGAEFSSNVDRQKFRFL
jgi:hypothetical protein